MAEEIIFKVGVNTGSTVNDLNKIEKELQDVSKAGKSIGTDVNTRFDELNKKVASGTLTMRESTRAVKEYQTIALQAGRDSPVGQQAIANAAKLTDELSDLRNEITRAGTDGANMQAALQLGSGIAASYGAVQGTMALLGVESESLQKTMVKLQAVQSVLAGIEQVRAILEKESFLMQKAKIVGTKVMTAVEVIYAAAVGGTTGAMKALRIAMLALPIVAIIAGIAALVAGIAWLVSEEEKAEAQNEALNKSYERQQEVFERASAARKRDTQNAIDLAIARGATESEVHQMEIDQIKENESLRVKAVSTEKKLILDKKNAYQQALKEGNEDLAREIKKEIDQARTKYNDLKGLDGQYKKDIEIKDAEFNTNQQEEQDKKDQEAADKQKAANEAAKRRREEEAKKKIELARTIEDLIALNIEDADQRAATQLAIKHQRERDELVSKYGKNIELTKQLEAKQQDEVLALMTEQDKVYDEKQKEAADKKLALDKSAAEKARVNEKATLEAKLISIEEDFYLEQELKAELALLEMEQQLANEELTAGEKEKIQADYNAKIRALDKETSEHNKALKEDEIAKGLEWAQKSVDAVQSITDAAFAIKMRNVEKGSKEEEKLAKQQFKINKALQLGGAVMDAGKAITASLAAAPIAIGPVPNPAGIASLAFASITSAANIAKIAATKFESPSGGGSGTVSPPTITSSEPQAPTLNNSTLTGGLEGSQPSATKVYVLDSDITAKQNDSKKTEALATFGG